jgi:hypothetical protein
MPVELARRAVVAGCPPGGVVLDPFAGSGTTGVAALDLGCQFLGVELYLAVGRSRGAAPRDHLGGRGILVGMSAPMHDHYAPGSPLPDPAQASGPTRWGAPVHDYASAPDDSAAWSDAVELAVAMPVVDPVTMRVGWCGGRAPEGPDAA